MLIKKIIIIIPYRGIGDLIFHIPFFKGISLKYKSKLMIFTNSANKAKNLLKNEKYIKNIEYLSFQREKQFLNSLNLLKKINQLKPDLCVVTAHSKRLSVPLLISNAQKKIFFKKDNTKDLSKYIFNQSKISFPSVNFKNNFSLKYPKNKRKDKIFISIDSHHDTNDWDEINYIKLIKKILDLSKIKKVFINFSPSKLKKFKLIMNTFVNSKKVIFTYNKKFDDVIRIINSCYYIIGNESGPICIAASFKKIIFSIYFPKHTNKSSKTIYDKVKFYNTNILSSKNIILDIIKNLK